MSVEPRVRIQTANIDRLTVATLLDAVGGMIATRTRSTVSYVNVHVLNEAARDPQLAAFLSTLDLCYADGKGVVLAARILGEHLPGRMTGADWIEDLAARSARDGWRIAWIGGAPTVTDRAARTLEARHPGALFVLTDNGYHNKNGPENDALLARLAAARPDIVLVGMGTPTQERWVECNRAAIDAPVVWCVGATADFLSGDVSRGPRVLYENQEWLARLMVDPKRLWRRFLIGNPLFIARTLRERARRG